MYLVNLTGTLRVSEEGELYGLELHEHGFRPTRSTLSLRKPRPGLPKDVTEPGLAASSCPMSVTKQLMDKEREGYHDE